MTAELALWIQKQVAESPKPSLFDSEPEFWLSRLVAEIEREATAKVNEYGTPLNGRDMVCLHYALQKIKSKFGL